MKHKRIFKIVFCIVVAIAAAVYATTALTSNLMTVNSNPTSTASFNQAGPVVGKANDGWLSQAALPSRLHTALRALGDRLERKGKERVLMTGVLRQRDEVQDMPFTLILELPGRARLTLQQGSRSRTLVYDIENLQNPDNSQDQRDREVLETLVFDSPEHFLLGQIEWPMSTRFLGERFHLNNAAESAFYDVFEAVDLLLFKEETREQKKAYCFNADSHLLERVIYQGPSDAREVLLSDWREIAGQQIPFRIERWEGKTAVLQFFIQAVAITPRLNDGAFTIPQ